MFSCICVPYPILGAKKQETFSDLLLNKAVKISVWLLDFIVNLRKLEKHQTKIQRKQSFLCESQNT